MVLSLAGSRLDTTTQWARRKDGPHQLSNLHEKVVTMQRRPGKLKMSRISWMKTYDGIGISIGFCYML
jgi:hypothetical protein